jgi:hypothetical protein
MSRAYSVMLNVGNIPGAALYRSVAARRGGSTSRTSSSPSTTSASVQNNAVRGAVTGLHGLTLTLWDNGTDSVTAFGLIFGVLAVLALVLITYAFVGIWFWREWNRDE